MLRLSWPASVLVAAAWYALWVVDAIDDLRQELKRRKAWQQTHPIEGGQ